MPPSNQQQMLLRLFLLITSCCVLCVKSGRIVGGRPARHGELPYQVSLRRSYNNNHFCGGSIISPSYVVTAAHCVYYSWGGLQDPSYIKIIAGDLNLDVTTKDRVERNVIKIIPHPDYNSTTMFNDIALLQLTESFDFNAKNTISPVKLPDKLYNKGTSLVSGWGKTSEDENQHVSTQLLVAEVDIVPIENCMEMYGVEGVILDELSMYCAGHSEGLTDACQGDSGGPLVYDDMLVGVVSTGKGCARKDYPGIYANVFNLKNWILENAIEPEPTANPSISTTTIAPYPNENSIEKLREFFKNLFGNNSTRFIPNLSLMAILMLITNLVFK